MKKTKKALASLAIASMVMTTIPFNAFAAGTVPTRIAGVTAEDTAVKIAEQTGYTGTAILASSASYGMVDALTSGPLASYLKAPILLTGAGNTLDAATKAELTKLAVKTVYVTSGTAVIKQGVLDELKGMNIEVIALGGFDRAATSVNIAQKMVGVTKVAIANGLQDALSIASVASAANQPILLTDKDALPASVEAFLKANPGITSSDVIGGTGVISDAVKAAVPSATRHYGMTAYDTNSQVIQDFASSLEFNNVYVANGVTGIDALAGAPLAAQTKSPIVLTDGKTTPAVAAFVFGKATTSTVVTAIGGEAVVPESVRVGVATGVIPVPGSNELKIVSVSSLDDTNRFLKMEFSKAVLGLEAANISIVEAKSGDAYGVKGVTLSANGLTAQLELFAGDDGYTILKDATEYKITVNVNGTVLTTSFVRSAHLDEDDNARVTKVDLENRQITVKAEVNEKDKTVTLDVPTTSDLNFQKALGQVIRVWYDGEDNLIKYQFDTEKIVYDAIVFDKADRVKTIDEEVKYDLSDDCVVIVNDGAKDSYTVDGDDVADIFKEVAAKKTFAYAKLIFNDDGDVERIYAYNPTDAPILVEEVDGNYIQGYDSDELDLEDFRIVNGLGMQIAIKDIAKDSIVFFNDEAYSGDGIAIVMPSLVKGEISEVFESSFDLEGENYDYVTSNGRTVKYVNADGDFDELDDNAAEQLQAGGEVRAYFDAAGELWYVLGGVGDVDSNSEALYLQGKMLAYIDSKGDFQLDFDGINAKGDDESYDFAIDDLDTIVVQTATDEVKYEVDDNFPDSSKEIDEFIYTSDAAGMTKATSTATAKYIVAVSDDGSYRKVVAELADYATSTDVEEQTNNVIKVGKNDDGDVNEITFIESFAALTSSIDEDDNYANGHELEDSTVVYDVSRADKFYDPDTDDVEVTTWGELKKSGVDIQKGQAMVYFDDDDNVTHLVTYSDSVADDQEFTALITEVSTSDGDIIRIKALVNGEAENYQVKDSNAANVKEGDLAIIRVNEAGTIVTDIAFAKSTGRLVAGVVTKVTVGSDKIEVDGVEYKLGSKGEVYDATDADGDDYSVEGGLRDVEAGDKVLLGLSATDSKFVDVVAMVKTLPVVAVDYEAINTAVSAANAAKVVVSADGTNVAVGTKWVTQAVNDALVTAIATANTVKTNATTTKQVTDAAAILDAAVVTYNAAKADGTFVAEDVMPTATLTAESTDLLGIKAIYVTLETENDTLYTVVVDGEALEYSTVKDQFVGVLETSKTQAQLQAVTVVEKI